MRRLPERFHTAQQLAAWGRWMDAGIHCLAASSGSGGRPRRGCRLSAERARGQSAARRGAAQTWRAACAVVGWPRGCGGGGRGRPRGGGRAVAPAGGAVAGGGRRAASRGRAPCPRRLRRRARGCLRGARLLAPARASGHTRPSARTHTLTAAPGRRERCAGGVTRRPGRLPARTEPARLRLLLARQRPASRGGKARAAGAPCVPHAREGAP